MRLRGARLPFSCSSYGAMRLLAAVHTAGRVRRDALDSWGLRCGWRGSPLSLQGDAASLRKSPPCVGCHVRVRLEQTWLPQVHSGLEPKPRPRGFRHARAVSCVELLLPEIPVLRSEPCLFLRRRPAGEGGSLQRSAEVQRGRPGALCSGTGVLVRRGSGGTRVQGGLAADGDGGAGRDLLPLWAGRRSRSDPCTPAPVPRRDTLSICC